MSLRFRLVALIVALVAAVALALSAFELDNLLELLAAEALERSQLASQQVYASLIEYINPEAAASADAAATAAQWKLVSSPNTGKILLDTLARWPSVVEVNVADSTGRILASSTESRVGTQVRQLEGFAAWRARPVSQRLRDIIQIRPDLEVTVKIGAAGDNRPLFTIQLVASTVLLRDLLEPQARRLAEESVAAILSSLILTLLLANLILGPVRRIEQTIDRIAQGNVVEPGSRRRREAKEFRAMENKLSLLGREYRGAREDARQLRDRIDVEVERIASQLDVATRLAAISRLTGGVAHEIKNPLNAILLRLDLLRARLGAPEEELAGEIGILSKEVLRLDRVVKTFLDFSRPLEVRFQDVDLAALVGEVADLMTPQASQSGIVLEFQAPPELEAVAVGTTPEKVEAKAAVGVGSGASMSILGIGNGAGSNGEPPPRGVSESAPHGQAPSASHGQAPSAPHGQAPGAPHGRSPGAPHGQAPSGPREHAPSAPRGHAWIRGDADLLKQAVLNLVTNAMEAMKTGGQLKLRVESSGGQVTLRIADTGPGIPPEVRPKVFQLYFTTKERGSGIGLAMTYRAVQLHNGTIEFESETGRGTTFLLQFPAKQAR
jgi:signal transduction histidine kinase